MPVSFDIFLIEGTRVRDKSVSLKSLELPLTKKGILVPSYTRILVPPE